LAGYVRTIGGCQPIISTDGEVPRSGDTSARWHKASFRSNGGTSWVEVARDGDTFLVRTSNDRDGR
jgi:hypothetical protein